MSRTLTIAVLLLSVGLASAEDTAPTTSATLGEPSRLLANGAPINVDVGHAAPHVTDWNHDGRPDLLVGQFGQGKLRIFLNEGTTAAPKFTTYAYFKADGEDATVPGG